MGYRTEPSDWDAAIPHESAIQGLKGELEISVEKSRQLWIAFRTQQRDSRELRKWIAELEQDCR